MPTTTPLERRKQHEKENHSLMLIFAMLVPLSPAVAADEPSSQPTIEEILNVYHQKAFEAQSTQDPETASTWSRGSGSNKTLEQETVEELTEAGYESYNVTGENYTSLETTLKTDFSEMGLDPDGSYIIVISGEENNTAAANSSRASDLLLPPHTENEGGSGHGGSGVDSFIHIFDGKSYTMRYVTVVGGDDTDLTRSSDYKIDLSAAPEEITEVLGALFWFAAGEAYGNFADIASLLLELLKDGNYSESSVTEFTLQGTTSWDQNYIQVYDPDNDWWSSRQFSSIANSSGQVTIKVFNSSTHCWDYVNVSIPNSHVYSPLYYQTTERKNNAVIQHLLGGTSRDTTEDISFYYTPESERFDFSYEGENAMEVFVHSQPNKWHP